MIFQERTYSVLIVSASEKLDTPLRALLPGSEYYPVQSAGSVGEARRMLLGGNYDLVLIHTPLKDDFGTQLAIDVCLDSAAGALLFVKAELYDGVNARVMEYGVMTLSMPSSSGEMGSRTWKSKGPAGKAAAHGAEAAERGGQNRGDPPCEPGQMALDRMPAHDGGRCPALH